MRLHLTLQRAFVRLPGVLLLGALLAGIASACGLGSGPSSPGVAVVTTFYPLQFLAERIGGDRVQVRNLVPAGAEPHDWEPRPQDIKAIQQAKVFVYAGAELEAWSERVISGLHSTGPVVVKATEGLELLPGVDEDGGEHALDPHVWLDPRLYARQAELVEAGLAKADPKGASTYRENLNSLKADLSALENDMAQGLKSCQRQTIVTAHEAFQYLANRFGLKELHVSGVSPEEEPSPNRLNQIVQEVRRQGATTIFFETLVSPKVSETIAREVGARTSVLDPIEGLTQEDMRQGKDYLSVQRQNLANIRAALECK